MADLFVDVLENECIRHDAIKGSPTRLSMAISLAKNSEKVWEKVGGRGGVWDRNLEGGRRNLMLERRTQKRKCRLLIRKPPEEEEEFSECQQEDEIPLSQPKRVVPESPAQTVHVCR